MADFAPNFTARYTVMYSTLGLTHRMMWRIPRGAGATGLTNIIAKMGAFLTGAEPLMFTDWTLLSATYQVEDSDFSIAAALPTAPTGAIAVPTNPKSQATLHTSFVGRSNQGQKARIFMWGLNIGPENTALASFDDFRVNASETTDIAFLISVLNGSPALVASDDNPVTWYPYVNTKFNDAWVPVVRA